MAMMMSSSGSPLVRASKAFGRLLSVVTLAVFTALPHGQVVAQEDNNIGILVVDMQKVQRDAAASVSVTEQIAVLRSELGAAIAKRSEAINREETELAKERDKLTAEELRTLARQFERKVFAHRDFEQQETTKLQLLQAQARAAIRGRIIPILTSVMRERNAQIMLDKTQVVLSNEALDVTDEVLNRLNEALPTLILSPPRDPE